MRLILASSSPRRREILTKLGYKFDAVASAAKEQCSFSRPHLIVKDLAFKKAFDVARLYPDAVVIGGDTIVYCKGRVLGKPKNKADALKILRMENGSWQKVYSGLAIICLKRKAAVCGYDVTACKARRLSEAQLKDLAGRHMDKAGAYAMQDKEDYFIERIRGAYDNVVGFPSELFKKMLKEMQKHLNKGDIK